MSAEEKKELKVDKSWTLFLDRDGVINERLPNAYVKHWYQFKFMEKVPEAISAFSQVFGRIVVVTNQQGIAKGLMTDEDLKIVHDSMVEELGKVGARIDGVYYCPDLATLNTPTRKPNPGMGYLAKQDFPEIDFSKSVMVGDSLTDIQFAERLGMIKVFVETKKDEFRKIRKAEKKIPPLFVDFRFPGLKEFAEFLLERPL